MELVSVSTTAITGSAFSITLPFRSTPVSARTGFAHIHLSTKEFFSMEIFNGCLGFGSLGHFDKTKPSSLTTILVFDKGGRTHLPEFGKDFSKIFF